MTNQHQRLINDSKSITQGYKPVNHTALTLGELMSHPDNTVQRHARGILARLLKITK